MDTQDNFSSIFQTQSELTLAHVVSFFLLAEVLNLDIWDYSFHIWENNTKTFHPLNTPTIP